MTLGEAYLSPTPHGIASKDMLVSDGLQSVANCYVTAEVGKPIIIYSIPYFTGYIKLGKIGMSQC